MESVFDRLEKEVLYPSVIDTHRVRTKAFTTTYNAIRGEAERLYYEGVANSEIARQLGTSRQAVVRWAQKLGWVLKRKEIRQKQSQTIANNVTEMRDRHIKITKAIQAQMIEQIRSGMVRTTISDGLRAMQHEALIMSPEKYAVAGQTTQITNIDAKSFMELLEEAKKEKDGRPTGI